VKKDLGQMIMAVLYVCVLMRLLFAMNSTVSMNVSLEKNAMTEDVSFVNVTQLQGVLKSIAW